MTYNVVNTLFVPTISKIFMRKILTFLAILSIVAVPTLGQNTYKKSSLSSEKIKTDTKSNAAQLAQMEIATQKIIFIDSVVVKKDSFLSTFHISNDAGKLYKYNEFFKNKKAINATVYLNGLEDKCYYAATDTTGNYRLYTMDKLNNTWTRPILLSSLNDEIGFKSLNYPFMMADGSTLYFSATGDQSIGGYDIFVTRYDYENGSFLKAENIGMPFNSTANDYMYVIDEINNLGWFATDRNQKEDNVCIYIFIPSESRKLYPADEYSEEKIKSLAKLERIADTWGDGRERKGALERLKAIYQDQKEKSDKNCFVFIVNDKTTYRHLSDFKSKVNIDKFQDIQKMEEQLSNINKALEKARKFYITANKSEKNSLKSEILKNEHQQESLKQNIHNIYKEIRNSENSLLNNN